MTMDTKMDIWIEVLKTKIPDITHDEAAMFSMQAASDWYQGRDTMLSEMFDQFVMLKNLKGIKNGEETNR